MKETLEKYFSELREQTQANPNLEARATTVQHRIRALYSEAVAANDMQAVRRITEEWSRNEIQLGQAIAVGQERTGKATG